MSVSSSETEPTSGLQSKIHGSPLSAKRKPVPTPRSTLRKPSLHNHTVTSTSNLSESLGRTIRQSDMDSTGQTSIESHSPDDDDGRKKNNRGEDGEDILAALEKIPGVGSLRSLHSVGSSLAESGIGCSIDRVKREDSSHSLGPQIFSLGIGQLSERSTANPRYPRANHHTMGPRASISSGRASSIKSKTSSSMSQGDDNMNSFPFPQLISPPENNVCVKIQRGMEQRKTGKSVTISLKEGEDEMVKSIIQERPLPDLPLNLKRTDSKIEEDEIKVLSTEDIYTSLLTPEDHYTELNPAIVPNVAPCNSQSNAQNSNSSNNLFDSNTKSFKTKVHDATLASNKSKSNSSSGYLTMTGTIKRGRFQEKNVDIRLNLTTDHFTKIEKHVHDKFHDRCFCGLRRGPHVFILSMLCVPFLWIWSTIQAFFLGSMTWYNIFLHYNEERTCCHTLLSPLVLLFYPFWIAPVTLFLGIYGGLVQISWYWDSWIKEVRDPDSGFMGWFCGFVNLPDCAPYQVIFLESDQENTQLCSPPQKRPVPI